MSRSPFTRPACLRFMLRTGLLFLAFLFLPVQADTESNPDDIHTAPHIEVSLVSEVETIEAGTPFQVAVRLVPDEGWHTYWRNPGDSGLPTRVDWTLPAGGEAGPIQWPYPERIDYQGLINYGYHGETLLLTRITPPREINPGDTFPIRADVHWLICKDVCIPGSGSVATTLKIASDPPQPGPWADRFAAARARLPQSADIDTANFYLDENLVMEVTGADFSINAGDKIQFFPIDPDLVVNAVEPRIQYRDGRLLIRTAGNPDYTGPVPEQLNGLLVIDDGKNPRAVRFTASAGASPIDFPAQRIGQRGGGFLFILLLAFTGGILLNLMPCVFPVLSIKILSLIKSGTHDRLQRKLHGLAYTSGILASILVFAGVLLGFRAAGEAVGWGFQLQSPLFVAILIYILFIMALALSGFVDIGTSLTRTGNLLDKRQGLTGSFLNGTLATIVATPCTVPFMATAVGFALTQGIPAALTVFAVLGLGLASPFLLLAFMPALAERLPKPGRWMETLKQFLAFPLYFTVIWLVWILDRLTGSDTIALVLAGLVFIVLALWLWRLGLRSRRPLLIRGPALLAVITALILLPGVVMEAGDREKQRQSASEKYGFTTVPYSESGLRQALAEQRPVFVNINADWCITCKVNEQVALKDSRVHKAFSNHNVLYMEGDWTDGDETLTRLLNRFERSGVPLYLLYQPGEAEPRILPQLLTPATVISALEG